MNLKYQFFYAIEREFEPGRDKHSDFASGGRGRGHIYSEQERDDLVNTASDFANYVRSHFDVRQVKDISPAMAQSFLNDKADSCTRGTVGQYLYRLNKIELICKNSYKSFTTGGWAGNLVNSGTNEQLRDIAFSREDYNRILSYAESINSKSVAPVALGIAGRVGLRVESVVQLKAQDIDLENMKMQIRGGKGGRNWTIEIEPKDVSFLKQLTQGKAPDERLVPIREGSVNKWLSRTEEKLNITRYKEHKTQLHAIRKMVATETYDRLRTEGLSHKDAWDKVSTHLGHGQGRYDLFVVYVSAEVRGKW